MEKENLIRIAVLSLVILAVAIPILTTCMAGLQKDGFGEYYDVTVKGEPDPEGGGGDNVNPLSARDMVEYAKEKGATSWKVEYHFMSVYSVTLYKGSKIIEQQEYETEYTDGGLTGKFVYDSGYSEITYHSASPYLTLAKNGYVDGWYTNIITGTKFEISCEGRAGTIKVYSNVSDTSPRFTMNVKMTHAWIPAGVTINPEDNTWTYEQWGWVYLNQASPPEYRPKFVDYDDIYWIGYIRDKYVYLHGEKLIGY